MDTKYPVLDNQREEFIKQQDKNLATIDQINNCLGWLSYEVHINNQQDHDRKKETVILLERFELELGLNLPNEAFVSLFGYTAYYEFLKGFPINKKTKLVYDHDKNKPYITYYSPKKAIFDLIEEENPTASRHNFKQAYYVKYIFPHAEDKEKVLLVYFAYASDLNFLYYFVEGWKETR